MQGYLCDDARLCGSVPHASARAQSGEGTQLRKERFTSCVPASPFINSEGDPRLQRPFEIYMVANLDPQAIVTALRAFAYYCSPRVDTPQGY